MRILLIEDNPADAQKRAIKGSGLGWRSAR
jgi:hypothetical protein